MKRNRLADIRKDYHCSIIGTCLSLEDVRSAFEKAHVTLPKELPDYEVHGMAVKAAGSETRLANKLNDLLDSRHRAEVYQASKCTCTSELVGYWDWKFSDGQIAGAYWAVVSHSMCSINLLQRAFGQVHMVSHITGATERTRREKIIQLQQRVEGLGDEVQKQKKELSQIYDDLRDSRKQNRDQERCNRALESRCRELENQLETLRAGGSEPDALENLRSKLQRTSHHRDQLETRVHELTEDYQHVRECNHLLLNLMNDRRGPDCAACDDDCARTELPDLENKTVLLVGGRMSIVPHYRSIVEVMNGRCLHFDGGVEQSMGMLESLLPRADIVVCFLNCLSHNAANLVKRNGKSDNKQVLMLKNSGVTSFKHALESGIRAGR